MEEELEKRIVNNIRALGIDMIENAKSGHPGIVLGAAPIIYTLYAHHLNISKEEFFNQYGFRIVILVKANFLMPDPISLKAYVDDILNVLSTSGYKNVKGFEVILEDIESLDIIFHAKGKTNDKQTFSDYDIVPIDD